MQSARDFSLDRMFQAVEDVRRRLLLSTSALRDAGIAYTVAGGNAVAAWVATIDAGATRNTPDVDILINRVDFVRTKLVLESVGFVYLAAALHTFLDHPEAKPRDAVRVLFAGEKYSADQLFANPSVSESHDTGRFHVLALEPLVRVKLSTFRMKDRVHLRDMIDVGLIDSTWPARLPVELAERLQHILDTPEG